jgi:hypothetical protein
MAPTIHAQLNFLQQEVRQRLKDNTDTCAVLLTADFRKIDDGFYICSLLDYLDLHELGFSRKKLPSKYSSSHMWVNRQKGFVIKVPFIASVDKRTPKAAVPHRTVRVSQLTKCPERPVIMIQPLVDISHQKTAAKELARRYSDDHRDLHPGNTGHFQGKAVFLDW